MTSGLFPLKGTGLPNARHPPDLSEPGLLEMREMKWDGGIFYSSLPVIETSHCSVHLCFQLSDMQANKMTSDPRYILQPRFATECLKADLNTPF